MQTTSPGRRARGQSPPLEAKTLVDFGRLMEAANLATFNIWRRKKSDICSLRDLTVQK